MTTIISPRVHDLGGFEGTPCGPVVAGAQRFGSFVFVDHMGPAIFSPGQGIDVRPHPHIGAWPRSPSCGPGRSAIATRWAQDGNNPPPATSTG